MLEKKAFSPHRTAATYEFVSDIGNYDSPRHILYILGIEKSSLSETANEIINFLEENNEYEKKEFIDFKWKLSAFLNIQDIFDSPIYKSDDVNSIFHLWYFYYESKYILNESLLCGLNGFYLSANILLRLFLEFNLLQNYYYLKSSKESSYKSLEKYFCDQIHPSWNTVINNSLPSNKFCKPIKSRIQTHHKGLSRTAAHPYHPDDSPKRHSGFSPEPSLEGIFFWYLHRMIIEVVLWVYYINFPTLFHPVNIMEKFGFNRPVGLFVDYTVGHFVKKSLPETDYKQFYDYSNQSQTKKDLFSFYNSQETLSSEQIISTWNEKEEGKLERVDVGYAKMMAKIRVIKEALSLRREEDVQADNYRNFDFNSFSYSNWKELYKKLS